MRYVYAMLALFLLIGVCTACPTAGAVYSSGYYAAPPPQVYAAPAPCVPQSYAAPAPCNQQMYQSAQVYAAPAYSYQASYASYASPGYGGVAYAPGYAFRSFAYANYNRGFAFAPSYGYRSFGFSRGFVPGYGVGFGSRVVVRTPFVRVRVR